MLCFAPLAGASQSDTLAPPWTLTSAFPTTARRMVVDPIGQLYLIDSLGAIEKRDAGGALLFRFSNNRLGTLERADVRDPFTILLYYPEYLTVVLLDRTLNPRAELSLQAAGFPDVGAVALSRENRLWLYDRLTYQLKEIDAAGNTLQESQDLSLLLPGPPQVSQIIVDGNDVLLPDDAGGIHIFNQFGQYQQTLPPGPAPQLLPAGDELVYFLDDRCYRFAREAPTDPRLFLPVSTTRIHGLALRRDRLFLLLDQEVQVFQAR